MSSSNRAVILATIAGLTAIGAAAALHAQPPAEPAAPVETPQPAEAPKADPADKAETVLGGPRVTERPSRPTLVARDSQGKLIRIEDRPEIVAVGMIELNGESKKAADKVLNEHGAAVAKALNEHQALFLQIQSARQSGDMKQGMQLVREMRQKAPQLWEPPLIDRLSKVIPVEKAVLLRTIVSEYLLELAAEGGPDGAGRPRPAAPSGGGSPMMESGDGDKMMGGGGGGMSSPTPPPTALDDPQTARRIENAVVIREMARSLKTLAEMRREQTDRLLSGLGLTPEQDSQIRKLIRDTGAKSNGGQPTPEAQRALIEEIKKLLTVEQQLALQKNLKNR